MPTQNLKFRKYGVLVLEVGSLVHYHFITRHSFSVPQLSWAEPPATSGPTSVAGVWPPIQSRNYATQNSGRAQTKVRPRYLVKASLDRHRGYPTINVATEFFKNHDVFFAERTISEALKSQGYHKSSMGVAPYGAYWRKLRRICTTEIFTTKRMSESAPIRQKCVNDLLMWIEKEANHEGPEGTGIIHITQLTFFTLFNIMGNLVLSRDLVIQNRRLAQSSIQR